MQRGHERWVPATRIPDGPSCVLPGDQQQAPPALSATVGIIDSSMISRRVSVAEMLHIPSLVPRLVASLAKTSLAKNQEWSRSCGTSVREARSLACGASPCVESVDGVQVAVVTGRDCGQPWGAIFELPSRNQPRVADRHRDGDGPVRVDESSVEKRTEQGRFSGGCAQ